MMFGSVTKSWKTTAGAVGAALVAVGAAMTAEFDGDPDTVANWVEVVTVVIFAAGLLFARDADKSSADHELLK